MKYRLAKSSDAKRIAEIQKSIKEVNSLGIFCHMGLAFLTTYYKLIIEDPQSVFVCAVDDADKIVGYNFMVLDAGDQNETIKKHKLKLALSAIGSIIKSPTLLKELLKRYKSVNNQDSEYIHNNGAHGGYWGWDPQYPDAEASFRLHELTLFFIKLFGVETLYFEVDNHTKRIYKFHKINGAKIENELLLPDGRVRTFMYYELDKHKFKL